MTHKLLIALFLSFSTFQLQAQNQFGWVDQISTAPKSLGFDQYNNLVLAGSFSNTQDFDPGPGVQNLTSLGATDGYVLQLDASGNLLWVLQLGGPLADAASFLDVDFHGNMVVSGYFDGILTINGDTLLNVPVGHPQGFMAKLQSTGLVEWVKMVSVNNTMTITGLKTDNHGDNYICGYFTGSLVADPENGGTQVLNAVSTEDMFVLKVNSAGQFVWVKQIHGNATSQCRPTAFDIFRDQLTLTGFFSGNVDFDPGSGAQILNAPPYAHGFVQKLDIAGNFVWVKQLEGTSGISPYGIAVDPAGNVLSVGHFGTGIDLDPGAAADNRIGAGISDIYVQKLNAEGDYIWGKAYGNQGREDGLSITTDQNGNIYHTGYFQSEVDFDPGTGLGILNGSGFFDLYMQKLDPDGLMLDLWHMSGTGTESGRIIQIDQDGHIVLVGNFQNTIDVNPDPVATHFLTAVSSPDNFILKMVGAFDYRGKVFEDLNANLLFDAGEPVREGIIIGSKNNQVYTSTNYAGEFHVFKELNGDTLFAVPPHSYWAVDPPEGIVIDTTQSNLNFALTDIFPKNRDICLSMVQLTPFRPGFRTQIVLQISNVGTVAVDSIPVVLRIVTQPLPLPLKYEWATPEPVSHTTDDFNWLVGPLDTTEMTEIRIAFETPQQTPNGTPITLSASAKVEDDVFSSNNGTRVITNSVGSYDPNDKEVTPRQIIPEAVDTSTLRYVIRFQNTGTYQADFVVLRDTLPADLDISMLKILAASHPYTWRLFGNRVLEFRFDNINLPDSTSNEPESHGFAAFTIQTKNGLPLGTRIENRAGIYFDYNDPVITPMSVLLVANPVKTMEPLAQEWINFQIAPNPIAAFAKVTVELSEAASLETFVSISDVSGKRLQQSSIPKGEKSIRLNGLPAGSYFVQVRSGALSGGRVLLIK